MFGREWRKRDVRCFERRPGYVEFRLLDRQADMMFSTVIPHKHNFDVFEKQGADPLISLYAS